MNAVAIDRLKHQIRERALALGFVRCGFAAVTPLAHGDVLQRWIDAGMAGSMGYIAQTRDQRSLPQTLLPSARSAIVVVASYRPAERAETGPDAPAPRAVSPEPGRGGKIARYARGRDYHRVMRERLLELEHWLRDQVDEPIQTRIAVDTAPLLEREIAMAGGLGFIGKNTLLITPGIGSYTVLAEILTSLPIPPDDPARPRCGSCDRCMRACPTAALVAPYQLDARRCISYLTIEHRDPIDPELRELMGSWLFGCDDCQQVCPYNAPTRSSSSVARDPDLAPEHPLEALDLREALRLRSGAYRRLVRGRSLARISRPTLIRNAAIVAATQRTTDNEIDSAIETAGQIEHPAVRETVRWARSRRSEARRSAQPAGLAERSTRPDPGR